MSRFIDTDVLKQKWVFRGKGGKPYRDEIDSIPTADVVEVVRCKDCIFNKPIEDLENDISLYYYCPKINDEVELDDYCSRGERREGEKMIKIEYGQEYSDCTCDYKVTISKPMTVGEFIAERLKDKREWGYFGIADGKSVFGNPHCEYSNGKIVTSQLPQKYLDAEIEEVYGSGGWSRSDFKFVVAETSTADVVEVKQGEWVDKWHTFFKEELPACSVCNNISIFKTNYCPVCGAKMDQ